MLNSVPVLAQAMLWPLVAAAIVLAVGRFLPNWLRRLIATAGALASLVLLWSLTKANPQPVELVWEPIDFFRLGPVFDPDGLSLLAGIVLAGVTAAAALGMAVRDAEGWTPWHGLILIALAGCLVVILAANVLALALGSGLLTLALVALTITNTWTAGERTWPPLSTTVPGVVATLLLFLGAVQMDAQVGHASLQAHILPARTLALVGLAGVLWLLCFPISKEANRPERILSFLLPSGTGLYLLARTQALAPVLSDQPWLLTAGGAMLLVGGTLAWLSSAWPGLALHQAGYALVFVTLLGNSQTSAARAPVPWPLVSLTLALGTLAIWWDSTSGEAPAARVPSWLTRRVEPWWTRLRSSKLDRWHSSWLGQHLAALLPAIALASLAGLPLTAGAIGRWRFYADIVYGKHTALLLVALVADTLLAAGLWTALRTASQRRPGAASLAAMIALALPLVVWGVAPNHLAGAVDLSLIKTPGVSTWSLGFLFALPWLAGAGLAYVSARQAGRLDRLRLITGLPWLYRAVAWAGDRLGGALYWLGQVGEGEGWWGWAIILLALGALFLAVR